mmetsp:Transcript_45675/g.66934  ORF Transcript_45675/g.66934 Transcript_45675/m.66934 type:complete len:94 (+) Transcript_45675:515-796(+)
MAAQFAQSLRSLLEERIKKNGGSPSFSEAKTKVSNMSCIGQQDQISVEQVLIFMGTGDEDVVEKASNKLHITDMPSTSDQQFKSAGIIIVSRS